MKLEYAARCAERLVGWLEPFTERIAVAGSIRRRRPDVNDIDLVAIPRRESRTDLLGTVVDLRCPAADEVGRRAAAEHWTLLQGGESQMSFVAKGIQVDLFFAAPDTWGSILVCRTGSKELNIWLAECARECGGKWHPTRGVYLGKSVSSRTEQEVYAAIGLPVIPPESRERSQLPRIMARAPLPVIEKL